MKLKRNYLFGTTVLAGILAVSAPAWAQAQQTAAEAADATQVDEIVVTGSRIRRDPTTAPTPLIQVTRETLLTSGQNTMIDYLATIPALSNSVVPSDTTGSGLGDGGLSFANLRSLGSGRTLTLVDGRRHVGSDGGNLAVDVDTIPRLLIQNIEIVTGGASSVYGADAVSGVLNFVMRTDFEGLEVDANYGQKNQDGQANQRVSALIGKNFFDDRLNVYAFGEYEKLDEVRTNQIDWLARSTTLVSTDADPVAAPYDGITDTTLFSNLKTMQRLRWGIVNLANNQPASALNNPNIPFNSCGTVGGNPATANYTNTNCTALNPGYSYVFDGGTARLANFGTRVGTGLQRVLNIGGDGELASEYGQYSQVPQSEAQRYQIGGNFKVTSNINAHAEVKYVTEETYDEGQPTFFDIFISDRNGAGSVSTIRSGSAYDIRLSDNAYIPDNLKAAILANRINIYSQPTATQDGQLIGTAAAPYARSALRGPDRDQTNTRDLWRGVISFDGNHDQIGFVKNVAWDIGYTYGQVEVVNRETGVDVERMAFASDAIRNAAGQIVCRVQNLQATNAAVINDAVRGGDLRNSAAGKAAIDQCKPLNIFGAGNQSAEALDYVYAQVGVTERNEQEQALATVSGQLWDFWGAGPLGLALGYEHRRELYEATGRDREVGDRLLFLNSGADRSPVEYKSDEVFTELSVPLFRDSFLGEYAELSGSYRYFDYTTTGTGDVYGVNFVYRPIRDIAFKTSYNTSLRVPNLKENFGANSATFSFFGSDDPCTTASINAAANVQYRDNRIKNCSALAALQGLTFDFAGATPITTDDFGPAYGTGSIEGVQGGNPNLKPEESTSFTFSTVLKPRFVPNFSLVLDYYEIEIKDVIATVTPQVAAQNCVNGPTLNEAACATIFRNNPNVPFGVGGAAGSELGGYISSSLNYAKRTTRGLDFDARYRLDMDEMFGRNWGRLDYSIGGTWLIEQKNFNNAQNPNDYTGLDSTLYYPRVRYTSSLTYSPNDRLSVNWSVDWQTAQDISQLRTFVANADSRLYQYTNTDNFARHDFTVRYKVRDDLTLRAGVVNAFDAEQAPWLGYTLYSNFDPYGTRYFVGLNFRPW
ncbi:TonB-dependent receptor domain-containing protein [Brevundimonas sp. 374]|uniref:TonB-dependent receptor domain-containing protein n=1 Tax=Brevundimonas sp. 374 TaxID=1150400 RepID=UPI00088DBE1D|nr:TonB-dependent receptor [Brevundimonas sp. 374]SDQ42391.1 Outer membrane receptor for ferrienterochelin and colicins [Brevundimonas sp. 374]